MGSELAHQLLLTGHNALAVRLGRNTGPAESAAADSAVAVAQARGRIHTQFPVFGGGARPYLVLLYAPQIAYLV